MMACVNKFGKEIQSVSARVDHVETKMGEFASTINNLIDAYDTKEEKMEAVKAKIADIEDRSRRNNLKIRGVPKSIQQ